MKLLQALRNAAQRLAADFEDSKLFDHSGEKGEFREYIVGRFLRPFLPECYGIGSRQVFSADGTSSNQIDIVLYDSVFSNVLFREAQNSLYPCESVYGTVEVKSRLSKGELETSISNIASVKCLARTQSDMCDILPFRRFGIGAGLTYDTRPRNPYLGFVFAYDGIVAQTAANVLNHHLQSRQLPAEHLPDFIFSYRQGYTVLKVKQQGQQLVPAPLGHGFDEYSVILSGNDTLPLFFLTLNICLNQLILKAPDFNLYWIQVVNDISRQNT